MEKLVKDVSLCDFRFCHGHYPLRVCVTNACAQLCVWVFLLLDTFVIKVRVLSLVRVASQVNQSSIPPTPHRFCCRRWHFAHKSFDS